MDYKYLFALVKGMLLDSLKGEPVNDANLTAAIHKIELAIDRAVVSGMPTSELEGMKSELLTISKAVWYADRGK